METNTPQQEILLIKKSSFCRTQLFGNDVSGIRQYLPYDEQLEAACWDGWLDAMLPDVVDKSHTGDKLYLWEVTQARTFLSIKLGEYPKAIDIQYSINPYAVLAGMCYE